MAESEKATPGQSDSSSPYPPQRGAPAAYLSPGRIKGRGYPRGQKGIRFLGETGKTFLATESLRLCVAVDPYHSSTLNIIHRRKMSQTIRRNEEQGIESRNMRGNNEEKRQARGDIRSLATWWFLMLLNPNIDASRNTHEVGSR